MGCQACKGLNENLDQVLREIVKCIENQNISSLKFFLKSYIRKSKEPQESILNARIMVLGNYRLNLLAYALAAGAVKSFKFLYESCRCSIEIMNTVFLEYSIDPLNLICEKNYFDFINYYLPIYFQYRKVSNINIETTIDFKDVSMVKENSEMYTPIQTACINGWIGIVNYLYQYNLNSPDRLLSITDINEYSGENCALISIRSGNIAIVKLLFENFKLDFTIKNKFGEGALQICAVCCSKYPTKHFAEVFMYLLDTVQVDFIYNHEEILLVLEDRILINHLESLLAKEGIKVSKRELDDIFRMKRNFHIQMVQDLEDVTISEAVGCSSNISSIPNESNETPFNIGSFMMGK